jgi:hypothetical protein
VIDEKTQAALSQIGREEKAAAAYKVSPIVRHRASMAELKAVSFAEPVIGPATSGRTRWLNRSYGLASLVGKSAGVFTEQTQSRYAVLQFEVIGLCVDREIVSGLA